MINRALIFIKPHAVVPRAVNFIEDFLLERGVLFEGTGELDAEKLKNDHIIDRHYFAIAKTAVESVPAAENFSAQNSEAFESAFGRTIESALTEGVLLNCNQAQDRLDGINAVDLNAIWRSGQQVKLGPGLYVSKLEDSGLFVLNGFYPAMKELFTAPGCRIKWYDAVFDPDRLPWKQFRSSLIGATDPVRAAEGSLRNLLLQKYRDLQLDEEPTTTKNGIHASAGPIEGLRERMVWLGVDPAADSLGSALLHNGFSRKKLMQLLENGKARFQGAEGPVFDITEDVDARQIPDGLEPAVNG